MIGLPKNINARFSVSVLSYKYELNVSISVSDILNILAKNRDILTYTETELLNKLGQSVDMQKFINALIASSLGFNVPSVQITPFNLVSSSVTPSEASFEPTPDPTLTPTLYPSLYTTDPTHGPSITPTQYPSSFNPTTRYPSSSYPTQLNNASQLSAQQQQNAGCALNPGYMALFMIAGVVLGAVVSKLITVISSVNKKNRIQDQVNSH